MIFFYFGEWELVTQYQPFEGYLSGGLVSLEGDINSKNFKFNPSHYRFIRYLEYFMDNE